MYRTVRWDLLSMLSPYAKCNAVVLASMLRCVGWNRNIFQLYHVYGCFVGCTNRCCIKLSPSNRWHSRDASMGKCAKSVYFRFCFIFCPQSDPMRLYTFIITVNLFRSQAVEMCKMRFIFYPTVIFAYAYSLAYFFLPRLTWQSYWHNFFFFFSVFVRVFLSHFLLFRSRQFSCNGCHGSYEWDDLGKRLREKRYC